MKRPLFLVFFLLGMVPVSTSNAQSTYTYQDDLRQSPIIDAIQLYYALNDFFFYPSPTASGQYELIDVRQKKKVALPGGSSTDVDEAAILEAFKDYAARQGADFSNANQRAANTQEVFFDILRRIAMLPKDASFEELRQAYADNPFLSKFFDPNNTASPQFPNQMMMSVDSVFQIGDVLNLIEQGGGSLFNFSLSAITQGVADFLIERANEEINATVFERLKDQMNKYPEFPILFPETEKVLSQIESYNYNVAINALKTKFTSDLRQIPFRASDLVQLPKYQEKFNEFDGFAFLFSGMDILAGLSNQQDPIAILHHVYRSPYVKAKGVTNQVSQLLRLSGFFSFALSNLTDDGDPANDQGWFNFRNLQAYPGVEKEPLMELFFGILYQISPDIEFQLNSQVLSFKQLLQQNVNDLAQLELFIDAAMNSFNDIRTELNIIRERLAAATDQTSELLQVANYEQYIAIAEEMLEIGSGALASFGITADDSQLQALLGKIKLEFVPLLERASNLVVAIEGKEFNAVVYDFGILLKDAIEDYYLQTADPKVQQLMAEIAELEQELLEFGLDSQALSNLENTLLEKRDELTEELKKIEIPSDFAKFFSSFFEYGNLIASIALAQDGEQVKEALRATALPVGGSRIKKHSNFNIAINAYLGYYYRPNQDTALVNLLNLESGFTRRHGIYAPIGVSGSVGFGKWGSLSAYGGLIDLGAIVSYRIDKNEAVPEIRLVNIFSPSVQLIYGFPFDLPFSLGGGLQTTPVNLGEDQQFQFDRAFNLFIAVDIPLYNLLNNKKITANDFFD